MPTTLAASRPHPYAVVAAPPGVYACSPRLALRALARGLVAALAGLSIAAIAQAESVVPPPSQPSLAASAPAAWTGRGRAGTPPGGLSQPAVTFEQRKARTLRALEIRQSILSQEKLCVTNALGASGLQACLRAAQGQRKAIGQAASN